MKTTRAQRGFTLIELLVSSTLAALAMTALLSAFVFLARNFTRLSNLQALETQSRRALAYLQSDLALAEAVKAGTAATASSVTLVLPSGEVTYTYDSGAGRLRRQAGFGSSPDLYLLSTAGCQCTSFAFSYYTGSGGSPASQLTPTTNTPYSIKQLQVSFVVQTPTTESTATRMQYQAVTGRHNLRNKRAPDGT
ncbi:MAG TPA: prepilin-type N-terminal cleavage/methylation domain-containing protein [Lacunisphaera sp.]|nr:prepilin-type N-terminal cleavage/methylation domain-containing protein [Lacunisphaera sp.]